VTSANQLVDPPQVFARDAELEELRQRLRTHKPFLVHGDSGAGKTLLITTITREFQRVLYCGDSSTGQSVFRALAAELLATGDPVLRRVCGRSAASALKTKSILALRGLVLNALRAGEYFVVLDHLCRTSGSLASDVREIIFWGNTPVLAVARSNHMEDLGFLASFFALRSERMHIWPFERDLAAEFARQTATEFGLEASNREEFLARVVQLSGGLPGPILGMIRMALLPKYRTGDYIKFSPLYIDSRLSWHAANAY
jgi:hypothetical protein